MAIRSILHHSHIEPLKKWLINDGWIMQDTKGFYEVLRATKDGKRPLIVYTKLDAKEHYSVDERDMSIIRAFLRDYRKAESEEAKEVQEINTLRRALNEYRYD